MQLRVSFPDSDRGSFGEGEVVVVRNEQDIRKAGFAAARAVRAWLQGLPFVPSTGDLHFNVYAEVESDEKPKATPAPAADATRPKRKRKASK